MAASVITMPPYECPTRTIGPEIVARTLARYAASVWSPRNGLAGATTEYPRSSSRWATAFQLDASAQPPWTSTTVALGPDLSSAAVLADTRDPTPTATRDPMS